MPINYDSGCVILCWILGVMFVGLILGAIGRSCMNSGLRPSSANFKHPVYGYDPRTGKKIRLI